MSAADKIILFDAMVLFPVFIFFIRIQIFQTGKNNFVYCSYDLNGPFWITCHSLMIGLGFIAIN